MFAGNGGWGRTNMVRLNKKLNPSLTGSDAEKLNSDLRKRIVGQEEAVEQIVNIYQMFLSGMTSPGPAHRKLPVPRTDRHGQDAHGRSHGGIAGRRYARR